MYLYGRFSNPNYQSACNLVCSINEGTSPNYYYIIIIYYNNYNYYYTINQINKMAAKCFHVVGHTHNSE